MSATGSVQPVAAAVVVAAGQGERFGLSAKALVPLGGKPMLAWTLDALEVAATVRDVVVVAGAHTHGPIATLIDGGIWSKNYVVVEGGQRRQDSVINGVLATASDIDVVLIHDAARPLVSAAQFEVCAQRAASCGAAILAVPVSDTLKRVERGLIAETVPRENLWAAQTPQGFRRAELIEALRTANTRDVTLTDEAALFEALGRPVAIIPGDRSNLKVTFPEDLAVAEALFAARHGQMYEGELER